MEFPENPDRIGLTIRKLGLRINRRIDREVSSALPGDITALQGRVIGFIRRRSLTGNVYQKDIEDEFQIRRSTATGMLQSMEKKGLLVREPVSQDGRLKNLVLTPRALKLRELAASVIDQTEQALRQDLTDEQVRTFFELCRRIYHNAE